MGTDLPPTEGLLLPDEGRHPRHRASERHGTEAQSYLEVIRSVGSAAELPAARDEARAALDSVLADVREALGLSEPYLSPQSGYRRWRAGVPGCRGTAP